MKKKALRTKAERFARNMLRDAEGGHDWNHVQRVMDLAKKILKKEEADKHIVMLAIILHDIADPKFSEGDEKKGLKLASAFLEETKVDADTTRRVMEIIKNISFKGGFNEKKEKSPELKVAQDADRLDALGAIGIARAFNYGGFAGRKIFDPEVEPRQYHNEEDYRKSDSSTINHFYEKLLKLKEGMNTGMGKKLAKKRHKFMVNFLEQFQSEMKGDS